MPPCRAGYSVLFSRVDTMLKQLAMARADYTFDRELRRYLTPDVLIAANFAFTSSRPSSRPTSTT